MQKIKREDLKEGRSVWFKHIDEFTGAEIELYGEIMNPNDYRARRALRGECEEVPEGIVVVRVQRPSVENIHLVYEEEITQVEE